MTEAELFKFLDSEGYKNLRRLPDGQLIGIYKFLFTYGLCVGLDVGGYSKRYCYPHADKIDAINAALYWEGEGDPEGNWVAKK